MKQLSTLLLIAATLSSCQPKIYKGGERPAAPCDTIRDTVLVPVLDYEVIDSLLNVQDSLTMLADSLVIANDTLAKKLLHSRLVISNVKYYLNICIRNPRQDKFLKGWIRRAVQE